MFAFEASYLFPPSLERLILKMPKLVARNLELEEFEQLRTIGPNAGLLQKPIVTAGGVQGGAGSAPDALEVSLCRFVAVTEHSALIRTAYPYHISRASLKPLLKRRSTSSIPHFLHGRL